ncbi:MAG: TetR/AcrR family transcriptional regulator [Actinomycetota bacterium]
MASRTVGQHHGNLRTAAIAAAFGEVERGRGVGLSVRALARTIGVSAGALYHHFADRTALLDAVARHGFTELGRVQDEVEHAVDSGDHLDRLILAYLGFAAEHPHLYRVMFTMVTDAEHSASPETTTAATATFDRLTCVVASMNADLDDADAQRRALLIWTLTHGAVELASWSSRLDPGFTPDRIAAETSRAAVAIATTNT